MYLFRLLKHGNFEKMENTKWTFFWLCHLKISRYSSRNDIYDKVGWFSNHCVKLCFIFIFTISLWIFALNTTEILITSVWFRIKLN